MQFSLCNTRVLLASIVLASVYTAAQAAGLQAELRSSGALIPAATPDVVAPSAPAGAVVAGAQAWVCDAARGFAPVVAIGNTPNPMLAIGTTGGIKLPISATTVPASCGQLAMSASGLVYITQAVVDTAATPSAARGVLRTFIDPSTGAFVGPSAYIAVTAGLDGNQPTAAALGPDGSLYVGFLKSGDIKRILNPSQGTTQVVQKIGSTPSGHPARGLAFVGNDLYIASVDALSVIKNATSTACTGGCNATVVSDGFTGTIHTGITSDGLTDLYFAVASTFAGGSQVWRFTPSTQLYSFVARGGADRTGSNASNFSFISRKTNLLVLDADGNLWIGDDTLNGTAAGAGRLWTVSNAALASLPLGSSIAGTNVQSIANQLRGPWFMGFVQNPGFTITFNADGTFTSTGPAASGTWTITPPNTPGFEGNPQAHLTFTDSQGVVLFSADFLMLNVDTLAAVQPWISNLGTPISGVMLKAAP
jgi:hypothetical protein